MKKRQTSYTGLIFKRLIKKPAAILGLSVLLIIVVLGLLAPYISPYDYSAVDIDIAFQKPNSEHWFGTDHVGRDVLSRLLNGTRYSLLISIASSGLSVVAGIILGSLSGYFGGKVDMVIMRFLDIIQALPSLLLAVCISSILGPGIWQCILALGISSMAGFARMLRASMMTVRGTEYVEAAQSINCSKFRTIVVHVLPNSISPLIVMFTMGLASAIISASSMSFVGLGVQPPMPEWGAMLTDAKGHLREHPYLSVFPGVAIMITVLCMNMVGDALRDVLDPKLKK